MAIEVSGRRTGRSGVLGTDSIDMAWVDRMNLLLLAPLFEILPVPLSPEDELMCRRRSGRVVDYAQNKRGMEVWVGSAVNPCHFRLRVAIHTFVPIGSTAVRRT